MSTSESGNLSSSNVWKIFAGLVVIVGVLALAWCGWHHYRFPYGWSHCCSKILGGELLAYAEAHQGRFPSGMATPEASLGLLYNGANDDMFYLLRGKTVPIEITRAALKNGKLGPESSGWHYVEGLTLADDNRIAIIWDKIGLGHNGERVEGGGHSVIFADGSDGFILGSNWPQFLANQQQMLAARSKEAKEALPALSAKILFPDGKVVEKFDGEYQLKTTNTSPNGSGTGSESGSSVPLRWFHLYPQDGTITFELTLPNEHLRSKSVPVTVINGRASPAVITFEMEKY